jgi:hypothetical protein
MGSSCFGMTDWDAIEVRIASLAARAVNNGWTLRRGDFVDDGLRWCCLLGAITLGEAPSKPQTFSTAVDIIGDRNVADALEAGFEGWNGEYLASFGEAFAIGQRLCRRYGADPLHPHSTDQP